MLYVALFLWGLAAIALLLKCLEWLYVQLVKDYTWILLVLFGAAMLIYHCKLKFNGWRKTRAYTPRPKMNRVKDLYETAAKFMLIPNQGQYIIGTHFKVVEINDFLLPNDELSVKVFTKVIETDRFNEFKTLVTNYQRTHSHGSH